jgi:protein-tyrosine-phosphatase
MLSNKLVKEFQTIIKDEANVDLTDEKAKSLSNYLVKYFEILMRMDKKTKQK